MAQLPKNKEAWLRRLHKTSLPSFSQNIQLLSDTDKFVGSHASELSRIILKDPSLTAAVLKLANSVQFNTYGNSIRTVSRGVMLIGHSTIKEICTSCLLLENFLNVGSSSALKSVLARSFHAAVQAKEILNIRGDKSVEEIFISALLLNIGEISVYASLAPTGELIAEIDASYPFDGGKEKDIIGCYFNELTLSLCNTWGIAPMIADTLKGNYSETSVCRSILLANSLALSCEKNGFSTSVTAHIKTIARFCGTDPKETKKRLIKASLTAQKSLMSYGLELKGVDDKPKPKKSVKPFNVVIDKSNQLDALQELSHVVESKFDLNLALQLILEGLSRGAGFSSCLVGLLNSKQTRIVAKHAIEIGDAKVKLNFDFNCAKQLPEIQQKVLTHRNVLHSNELREKGKTIKEITGQLGFCHSVWGPLIVKNKVIGCIYADNGSDLGLEDPSHPMMRAITEEQIAIFKLFVYQAKINFSVHNL